MAEKYISLDDLLYYHAGLKRLFALAATTLAGYGITNAYTKAEVDALLNGKAASSTTLAGYGITDAYTKDETDQAILDALEDVTGLHMEVVNSLPAVGESNVIYLVPNSGTGTSLYDEYIYAGDRFELIGSTATDLSGYIRTTDLIEATEAEIDTVLAS